MLRFINTFNPITLEDKLASFKTNEELPATLSATDISKYLGISKANSYQLMNRSDFPTLKLGKRKLVPKDKFLIWVNNNTNVI